jgi:hypothetical protein
MHETWAIRASRLPLCTKLSAEWQNGPFMAIGVNHATGDNANFMRGAGLARMVLP